MLGAGGGGVSTLRECLQLIMAVPRASVRSRALGGTLEGGEENGFLDPSHRQAARPRFSTHRSVCPSLVCSLGDPAGPTSCPLASPWHLEVPFLSDILSGILVGGLTTGSPGGHGPLC